MRSLKILIISTEFPPGPGGIGKHAYDMARALYSLGYEVNVFTSQDYSNDIDIAHFNNQLRGKIDIVRFVRGSLFMYFNRWSKISNFLKHNNTAKVIVTGRFSLWIGYLLKRRYGGKLNVHAFVHGSELSNKNPVYHYFTSQSLLSVDHIWAVSAFTRELLFTFVKRNDINVLPNGLWFDDWRTDEKPPEVTPLNGNPSLLTVGRLSPRKGQNRVVKALSLMKKHFPDIHYHMIGIPTTKENILSLAIANKVDDCITIHGKIPSAELLQSYYKSSQVFIMLSESQVDGDTEGFGIAILEANYFGIPAIGAKGCGIEDAINDGYNGKLVDGNNEDEILKALKEIMNSYEAYSERAKQWALKHDWKELIGRFEGIKGLEPENGVISKAG